MILVLDDGCRVILEALILVDTTELWWTQQAAYCQWRSDQQAGDKEAIRCEVSLTFL